MLNTLIFFILLGSPGPSGDLEMFIFSEAKVPIENALVILNDENGDVLETKLTDVHGISLFENISSQTVSIVICKEGRIPLELKSIQIDENLLNHYEFFLPKAFLDSENTIILDGWMQIELTPMGKFPRIAHGNDKPVFFKQVSIPKPTHLSADSLPNYIVLEATLSKSGEIVEIRYDPDDQELSGIPIELSYLAKLTLQKWKFLPANYFGRDVSVRTKVKVPFEP